MNRRVCGPIRSITIIGVALALSASVATVALAQSPTAPAPSVAAQSLVPVSVVVDSAWARVSPMVDVPGAAYLVIHNEGLTDTALVSVSTPAARVVEMHETAPTASGGMMMMQPLAVIPVPAGGTVSLAPGGYHLMLIDLVAPLVEGTTVDLTLTFQDATVLTVPAAVRSSAPMASGMPMGTMPMGSAAP